MTVLKALNELLDAFAKQVATEVVAQMNASESQFRTTKKAIEEAQPEEKKETKSVKKKAKQTTEKVVEEAPAEDDDKEEEEAQEEEVTYSLVDVRKVLGKLAKAGKRAEVNALIKKYHANKLSSVKEEDYAALMADAEAL